VAGLACVEVEQLRVKLTERDDVIIGLRQQSTETVSQLEQTHMTELLALRDHTDQLQQLVNNSRSTIRVRLLSVTDRQHARTRARTHARTHTSD